MARVIEHTVLFLIGLVALVAGAEFLVNGASRLAKSAGISPLVIGLTVVAFGTSTPEGAVTVGAALSGSTDLAMGNIVGSNIFNLLLILGMAALVAPLAVQRQLIRQEVPVLIGVSILLSLLVLDGQLSRIEAGGLFVLVIVYTGVLVRQALRQANHTSRSSGEVCAKASVNACANVPVAGPVQAAGETSTDPSAEAARPEGLLARVPAALLIFAGLVFLAAGGNWLVDSAVVFARAIGVSELVIGLTVVAVGTSLPEAATAIAAVGRGETDLAVGNAVGSNLFNILGCLGLAGMVSPVGLSAAPALLNFDLWVMVAAAAVCLPIAFTGQQISRTEGAGMLGYCLAYLLYTLLAATHHDALPAFSWVMLVFVVPITLLVLIASVYKQFKR